MSPNREGHEPLRDDFLPTCSISVLRQRAEMLTQIRQFLTERGYWEVETPMLSADVTIDTHLEPFAVPVEQRSCPGLATKTLYLQTSPEFAMKRLLAAGSGSIFQITHAFRQEESGAFHNPEFTILEWYRVGSSYHDLMTEVGLLACQLLDAPPACRLTYQEAFERHLGIDPHSATDANLAERCSHFGWEPDKNDRDGMLNFLLATVVEPNLGLSEPTFLYDYPATQAALSRIDTGPPAVAQRFELYFRGMELCNGYQELTDADELRRRNHEQNQKRQSLGKPMLPVESRLLAAMDKGLPECTGVAVGFDRLVMLRAGLTDIALALPFPLPRA